MSEEKILTLEESFAELDKLVKSLENPEVSLEESFQIYKKGMELLKECNHKIDTVEKKMLQMNKNGDLSEF
ncbi:exodeoxyribonuclease VII small subunit [Novisyntrophococcus fermenticellae]|uniref:exodeoxyribonuclease VII small subunit n=1 Tax=Novisyntrophococcus fermenticellae TaxID=2068655 RepID=UPI001E5E07B5|nr:exodeoxyribonuclease VII small subunit [Novisyntrophococcus fermenticellae]